MGTVSAHVNAANIMASQLAQELEALRVMLKMMEGSCPEGFANVNAMVSLLAENAHDIAEVTETAKTGIAADAKELADIRAALG